MRILSSGCLVLASALAFAVLYCSFRGDIQLSLLKKMIGDRPSQEWYYAEEARSVYHGALGWEAEFIYWWPVTYLVGISLLAVSFFCHGKIVLKLANLFRLGISSLFLFAAVYFWQTWSIVSIIID